MTNYCACDTSSSNLTIDSSNIFNSVIADTYEKKITWGDTTSTTNAPPPYTTTTTTGTSNIGIFFDKNAKENNTKIGDVKMDYFDFGPVGNTNSIRLSPFGIAVRNNANTWVAYDKEKHCIVNTDFLNIPQGNKYIYKVPVALTVIQQGDIIVHNQRPMFVMEVNLEKKNLFVVDIYEGEEKTILPTQSPFGFNFITKIVSIFDFGDPNLTMGANENNPFGNLLPILMFAGTDKDFDPMLMMFIMSGQNPFAKVFPQA